MSEIEKIVQDFEKRISNLESQIAKNPVHRVQQELLNISLLTTRFQRVPENYYQFSLQSRANILQTTSSHLCKSIIVQNTACLHENYDDRLDSKYYCIIIQYEHKLNGEKLNSYFQSLTSLHGSNKKKFHFQMVSDEKCNELTGFVHNAVCPIGLLKKIPIIVCQSCLQLSPPIIWMGGGEVDLKLGAPVVDFINSVDALVGDISEPREISFNESGLDSNNF